MLLHICISINKQIYNSSFKTAAAFYASFAREKYKKFFSYDVCTGNMTLCRGQRGARVLLIGQMFLIVMSNTSYYEYTERLLC